MSRKRDAPSRWPAEVYDYERRVITDPAVGGLDLRKGSWIHCKWCNATLALKVVNSYSLASWNTHQRGKKHCGHEKEFLGGGSQPQLVSCSSQSSVRSSAVSSQDLCKSPAGSQSPQHHLQLMRVRRELQQSKQYQARHERDVANVINAMTNLISDQQGDVNSLQHGVSDMMHEIEALKKELERIQQKDQQRRVQAPQKKELERIQQKDQQRRVQAPQKKDLERLQQKDQQRRVQAPQKKDLERLQQKDQQRRVQAPQKKVVAKASYNPTEKPATRAIFAGDQASRNTWKIKPKTQNKSYNKRNSVTDMDIFEKRFRLA